MWYILCNVCLFVLLFQPCASQIIRKEINEVFYPIAGIFEPEANVQRRAFSESMKNANLDDLRLGPLIVQPTKTDSYSVWKELCSSKSLRPIAIFGPQNPITDGAVRDQCTIVNIPHLQATWQPLNLDLPEDISVNETEDDVPTYKPISINFYPDSEEISMAYAQLLKYYAWESFTVLYEDTFGLMRVQKILAEYTTKYPIIVRRLDPNGNNHKIFKELQKYKESRFLLDCHIDNLHKYINEAKLLKLVTNPYEHYIITSMDTSVLAEELSQYPSNFTWLSMTNYDELKDTQHFLAARVGKWVSDDPKRDPPKITKLKNEALMMDDMANHVLMALKKAMNVSTVNVFNRDPCNTYGQAWSSGALLQDQILKTNSIGVTGKIQFNDRGKRVNYTLNVNEIYVSKTETIGEWEQATGDLNIRHRRSDDEVGNQLTNKEFVIISRNAKPYFYKKEKTFDEEGKEVDSEEDYEGFSVDLVKAIFKILNEEMNLNYTYIFSNETHESYGKFNPNTKKWDGLIGDLLDKKADLAVCDLTITEERKKVVDFSVPIMTLGISILFTKERKVPPGKFSFLNPYSFEVWMYVATAYCVVSIVLFICSRISPADWENPQPCDKDPEELENIWNFKNCTWLTMGSIMTQGCDILPKAIGSRWVCGIWWFFAMIVCQTYIAQLAASMTSALENAPINSVDDLAKQNKILYGALNGGSTLEFFKNSKDKMYQRMYENMMANDVVLVKNNDEGESRVLSGKSKYAFFMESSTIEYKLKRNCDLKKVGGQLDSKDYGIAMPANSPFRSNINRAILRLNELTKLEEIKNKWWNEKYGAKTCDENTDEDDDGSLELQNLIGAFLVLIVGLAISVLITAAEFMNEVRNIVVREKISHKEAFTQELKASLNFFQLQKPVLRNPSRAPSLESSEETDDQISVRPNMRVASTANFIDLEKIPQ